MSHLNHLKEQINVLHQIKQAQSLNWTDLFSGRETEVLGQSVEPYVWICSFLLPHQCYHLCCFLSQSPSLTY